MRRLSSRIPCFLVAALLPGAMAACGLGVTGTGASVGDASVSDAREAATFDSGAGETTTTDSDVTDVTVADVTEASPPDTGIGESGIPEAASCSGVICNGTCLSTSDCHTCPGAHLLCGPTQTCVATCEGCKDTSGATMPIGCFACDISHQNPIGTCQYDDAGTYCLSGDYQGQYEGGLGYLCSCTDGGSAACPGATQVCAPLGNSGASFCLTCGETTTAVLQGQACQGGGACQQAQAVCQ